MTCSSSGFLAQNTANGAVPLSLHHTVKVLGFLPSNGIGFCPDVQILPRDQTTGTEELPEVAEDTLVKGVLRLTLPQVGDPVAGHELPGGRVAGGQVKMRHQQQGHHHSERDDDEEGEEEEGVALKPFPRRLKTEAGPFLKEGKRRLRDTTAREAHVSMLGPKL